MIDKKSAIPVYFQLKEIIKQNIINEGLKPGEPIFSEREYCTMYDISRMTVRQALRELENEGVIVKQRGKGSFVAEPKIEQEGLMSFTEMVKEKNMIPSTEVIDFSIVEMKDINSILEIEKEDKLFKIVRIRKADDIPVALEEVFIPCKFVDKLEQRELSKSLHKILEDFYHLPIKFSKTNFSSVIPSEFLKNNLDIKEGISLLKLENINYSKNPVYYETAYYNSEKFKINVILNRK